MEELPFRHFDLYFILPGREPEADKVGEDYVKLFKSKNAAMWTAVYFATSDDAGTAPPACELDNSAAPSSAGVLNVLSRASHDLDRVRHRHVVPVTLSVPRDARWLHAAVLVAHVMGLTHARRELRHHRAERADSDAGTWQRIT